jgi:hypothetical protein
LFTVSPTFCSSSLLLFTHATLFSFLSLSIDRITELYNMMEEKAAPMDAPVAGPPAYTGDSTALSSYIKPQHRKPHDSDVTFEEYNFYAEKTREEEKTIENTGTNWREILLRKKQEHPTLDNAPALDRDTEYQLSHRLDITDEEWTNASRAFRTASWGACKSSRVALRA